MWINGSCAAIIFPWHAKWGLREAGRFDVAWIDHWFGKSDKGNVMAIGVVTETGVRVNQLRNEHLNMIKATVCYA